jgi:hypothetical protein
MHAHAVAAALRIPLGATWMGRNITSTWPTGRSVTAGPVPQ